MKKNTRIKLLFLILFLSGFESIPAENLYASPDYTFTHDTIFQKQLLNNGRIWRNSYLNIQGHPYLFSDTFLTASVTVAGKTFGNVPVMYDIIKDEILAKTGDNIIIQLNKEMVDAFTIGMENRFYDFVKIENDTVKNLSGYVNVLYDCKTTIWVKYRKYFEPPAIGSQQKRIYQVQKIYIIKNGQLFQISNKSKLLGLFKDKGREIRDFIRKNRLRLSVKIPDSLVPVVEYYDSLNSQNR